MTYQIIADGVAVSGVVSGGRNAPRMVELEAQVGLGALISIAFLKGAPNHAMGITDVSMTGVVRCGQPPISPTICVREQFNAGSIPGVIGACQATPYGAKTIIRPVGVTRAPDPVAVKITGYVDDELLINGARTQEGQFPFMGSCNGAHAVDVSFVSNEESFSIAAGDNHGGQAGYDLTICFASI